MKLCDARKSINTIWKNCVTKSSLGNYLMVIHLNRVEARVIPTLAECFPGVWSGWRGRRRSSAATAPASTGAQPCSAAADAGGSSVSLTGGMRRNGFLDRPTRRPWGRAPSRSWSDRIWRLYSWVGVGSGRGLLVCRWFTRT